MHGKGAPPMATKLELLAQKRAALDREIAREKTKAKNAQRREEDRRKVLLGAFVLEHLKRGNVAASAFNLEGKTFADWLTRDDERALFGIPSTGEQKKPG
jgi:hypothetical protein